MEDQLSDLLRKAGLCGTYAGFRYLITAVRLVCQDESYLYQLTKRLYPDTARVFHSTPACVEQAMRSAINHIWERGDPSVLEKTVGYRFPGKPYLGEFIDILSAHLRKGSADN